MRKGKKNPEKKFERELIHNRMHAKHGHNKLVLILDHLKRSYNIGKIFRTAEVFSLHEIHLIGTKDFDPYPAKGALKRVKCHFFKSLGESLEKLETEGYQTFIFDTNTDQYLESVEFPEKTALLFGNEEFGPMLEGINTENLKKVKIRQYGKIESLNVSIAASIGAYEYLRQHSIN